VAGRVRQGARIFLQRVGEATDVGLKKSAVSVVVANGLLTERASARLRRQECGTSIGTPLLASYISLSCIFA
jgi:hypothetical protein